MTNTPTDFLYTTQDGDMLDAICWKHYGTSHLTTELVLKANYRLSDQPPVLPRGLKILLPAYQAPGPTQRIQIWD
ncbi:tail protein X [Hyphomicrobium sp.]|uniref:tail protein X n=1 Tax=Hyphomicrobium sp. TaxID=82 RepID=UPI001D2495A8|nr:tail protein X [Hyphomicrobium sp.]MBY0559880.1 tail protein X [Hyphomicrobium sp.]